MPDEAFSAINQRLFAGSSARTVKQKLAPQPISKTSTGSRETIDAHYFGIGEPRL